MRLRTAPLLLAFALAVASAGCTSSLPPKAAASCTPAAPLGEALDPLRPWTPGSEDRAVYAAALADYLDDGFSPAYRYVLNPHTARTPDNYAPCLAAKWVKEGHTGAAAAATDFLRVNARSDPFPHGLSLHPDVQLPSAPSSAGRPTASLSLSRVGFSADSTVAILALNEVRGPLNAHGLLGLLEKRGGRWEVVGWEMTWIS